MILCRASFRATRARWRNRSYNGRMPLAVLTLSQVPQQTLSPESDLRLQASVSRELVNAPLQEVISGFQKGSGVILSVDPSVRDRKVTVLFSKRSAGSALGAIARALFLDWRSEPDGYRLSISRDVLQEEERQRSSDARRFASVLRNIPAVLGKVKDMNYAEASQAALRELSAPSITNPDERLGFERTMLLRDPVWAGLGGALGSPDVVRTLSLGNPVYFTYPQAPGAIALPKDAFPGLGGGGKHFDPTLGFIRVRLRADEAALTADVGTHYESPYPVGVFKHTLAFVPPPSDLTALDKRLAIWSKPRDEALLETPVDPSKGNFDPGGYRSGATSLGEHLRYLFRATGTAIVGDAFRVASVLSVPAEAKDVGAYMEALRRRRSGEVGIAAGAYRAEKGWLMVRHEGFWRILPREVPEAWIAPLEAAVEQGKPLTLDDYAGLASRLNSDQAGAFDSDSGPLLRFPRLPISRMLGSLRLWGSLSNEQRRLALGSGLNGASLSASQLALCSRALFDHLWQGITPDAALRAALYGVSRPEGLTVRCVVDPNFTLIAGDPESVLGVSSAARSGTRATISYEIDGGTVQNDAILD